MRPAMPGRSALGFSLIELSVVIIVIGLILGGVVAGDRLVQNAKLASVGSEVERYRQAAIAFRTQYQELPGDFTRAETLWGSDTTCPNSVYSGTLKQATCNGNGSGIAGDYASERYRFWQHLGNAKLVDTLFNGTADTGGGLVGINVPKLRLETGGLWLDYRGTVSGSSTLFDDQYGHTFTLAANAFAPVIAPSDAKALDAKFDDGVVSTGTIKPFKYSGSYVCANSGNTDYNVTSGTARCHLIFNTGF